jgi:hypothetical protein
MDVMEIKYMKARCGVSIIELLMKMYGDGMAVK